MNVSRARALILWLIPLSATACSAYGEGPQDEAQKVTVTTVQSKAVTLAEQYVCQLRARRHIEVRAPAEGYLSAIAVGEGQAVKTGDVMFEILPILFKARLDAELAERDIAQLELNTTKRMAEKQGVSQIEVKLFEAKLAKAQAKAELASAKLNFTKVKAPFDGMVGRLPRQLGSLVLKGETLTTLSDNSMIRAEFNISEARYLESMAEAGRNEWGPDIILMLANHSRFPQSGKLGAIGAEFHAGNITFRADFPNPDRLLRHGQTGTVLISRVQNDAVVIPQRATFEALNKRYVYVVDKDDVAHQREIVIRNESEDFFVIKKGVEVGDRIVVEGVRRARDGAKVEYEGREPKGGHERPE